MKIRNITCIAGAIFGAAYTVYGMYGAYRTSEVVQSEGMKILEGLVFCAFTIPFGAVVGLGLGLLLEGAFSRQRFTPAPPEEEDGPQKP